MRKRVRIRFNIIVFFDLECVEEKATDNYGNGNLDLYGTRNFRTILHGVAYRGGGNNYYHNENKRGQ